MRQESRARLGGRAAAAFLRDTDVPGMVDVAGHGELGDTGDRETVAHVVAAQQIVADRAADVAGRTELVVHDHGAGRWGWCR